MGSVVIDMSMSLDGYIAAPNDNPEQRLGEVPCFVVTHRPPASSGPIFTFVTDGIEGALAKAREVAAGKRIGLMGADLDQQFLAAGLVDEIRIHLVNVLLGGGRRLFDELPERVELEQTGLSQTDDVTHLEYRVVR
jgi:dihydrofolate reductase